MSPKRLGLFETTSCSLELQDRFDDHLCHLIDGDAVQLHNSRWNSVGLQVVDYYGAAEAHAYMTEHMNRYYGFNVMPRAGG